MIYTAIDTFYVTDEQLQNSPSRSDGIDETTETTLRIYGCDLIQESGILLKLPQAVMATGQVLLHRFYCKKSFARFNVKRVAASCVWLASKLEESPRKARQVLIVFHRMECRRENLPVEHLDPFSKKYAELKMDLNKTERHLLKEMGFICHVEHPHKFISNYLAALETPRELTQEAWNLANDSLRTTLCVRFKSEVVACGVVYAAARRFQVPLPENPPWWKAFDADIAGIDEVCKVLAHLYSLPKAQYIPVCRVGDSFTTNKSWDSPSQPVPKYAYRGGGKEKSQCPNRSLSIEQNQVGNGTRERERDDTERDRDKSNDRGHRSKDKGKDSGGHSEKLKRHSSRDRDYHSTSYSREKDRHRIQHSCQSSVLRLANVSWANEI
ncbi:arginine-rich cyclin 1 [Actinidia rufa]|uniref:Cyclin-L1-1 n=1 Tax=Actinidia rufa TaxID=165716 RepID=A0A7J0F8A6_9ERIC|nr:arginine-rich cyclin 1 [Actinidia rufa]